MFLALEIFLESYIKLESKKEHSMCVYGKLYYLNMIGLSIPYMELTCLSGFQMRSSFMDLKSNKGNSCNSDIVAAERRRLELMAERDSVCRNLDYNHQIKAQLQKQLQNILITQAHDKGMGLKTT